jgi:hypothetical protein
MTAAQVERAGLEHPTVSDRALAAAGVQPVQTWELDSSEAIKRAAREGLV